MNLPTRHMLMGMTLGAFCASALAIIGPGFVLTAFADEMKAGIDVAGLVRHEGRDYDVQHEDWVSTEEVSRSRIKKIEFGRVSYVDVVTTSTGTYSTDAMFSDHMQYPGISVAEAPSAAFGGALSIIGAHGNWVSLPLINNNSIVQIRTGASRIFTNGRDTCIITRNFTGC